MNPQSRVKGGCHEFDLGVKRDCHESDLEESKINIFVFQ